MKVEVIDIEKVLEEYVNKGFISDVEFHGSDENNWQYYFVYKNQQGYRFSIESFYDCDDNKVRCTIGFYNYDTENDKCSACLDSRILNWKKTIIVNNNERMTHFILDLENNIKYLIKEFQLEHVFKE